MLVFLEGGEGVSQSVDYREEVLRCVEASRRSRFEYPSYVFFGCIFVSGCFHLQQSVDAPFFALSHIFNGIRYLMIAMLRKLFNGDCKVINGLYGLFPWLNAVSSVVMIMNVVISRSGWAEFFLFQRINDGREGVGGGGGLIQSAISRRCSAVVCG